MRDSSVFIRLSCQEWLTWVLQVLRYFLLLKERDLNRIFSRLFVTNRSSLFANILVSLLFTRPVREGSSHSNERTNDFPIVDLEEVSRAGCDFLFSFCCHNSARSPYKLQQ